MSVNLQEEIQEFISLRESDTAFIIRGKISRRHARTDRPRRYFTMIIYESNDRLRALWHESKTYWFLRESEPWKEARKSDLSWLESVSARIERLIEKLRTELGTERRNIELVFELNHKVSIENLTRNKAIRRLINSC